MPERVLVIAGGEQLDRHEAALVDAAQEALGEAAERILQEELQARLEAGRPQEYDAPVMVLLPSVRHPATLGRRLHACYADTHLVFVQHAHEASEFRRGLGIAPMLGQHWSIAEAQAPRLASIVQLALASVRRRRQLRTTLDAVNQRLAVPHALAANDYQRLVASEYHLASFLRHSSDAVIGLDPEHKVLFWSQGAAQLLGVLTGDALGRPLSELGSWADELLSAMRQMQPGLPAQTMELGVALRGQQRILEAVLSLPPTASEGVGASVVLRDVTEQRQVQQQLREANLRLQRLVSTRTQELEKSQLALIQAQKLEAVGRLTGGVAHDFNNVLQIIGSNLQLLQAAMPDAGASRLLRAALDAVDRGAKLSSQLLAFARKQPLSPIPLNVSRRVAQMGDLLLRALGEDIEVETVLAAGLWTTQVDANQLENVILNLAINSRDAMPGGGKLTIETANVLLDEAYTREIADVAPGQYVMVAVSDTGQGMTPEVLASVFEPFFTTKPEGQGTGLGLSMAYGFAKQSGGHIRIYSEPGCGTTVKIYLPRSHEKEVQLPAGPSGPVKGGSETVLVVEDDLAVQAAVVGTLQALGYHVLRANDAQAALNILQSGVHVDLLFTDVVMPGPLRSPELAERARAVMPGIAVLFTSGYTQNAIVHGGRLDPGVQLLSKPYRQEDLARKVRQLLGPRPTPPPVDEVTSAGGPAPDGEAGVRILLVDDQDDLRESTLQILEMLGYPALGAGDADGAEALLAQQAFDILITDVGLPGRDGVELALSAVRRQPAIKVVYCSGYGAPAHHPPDLRSWTLPKPFALPELQALIEQLSTA